LALGVRLNVQENTSEVLELLSPDDPLRGVYSVYTWLGWLQESLLSSGVRLNVQENTSEVLELLSPDDPLRGVYSVYTWLGWLQESLLSSLMDE